jgi:4-amino-4-deoxy-L-arabinose transferase-like glycosyltransferase
LLGTVVLGMGIAHGLYRWAAYAVLLALGGAAWREVQALLRWLRAGLGRLGGTGNPWVVLYASAVGAMSLGLALLPPTGWDTLVYHLQGPRLYVEARRLLAVPDNFYLNWPAQVEMLFTWGLLLKGDTLAKLLHWVCWPLTAVLLHALARRTIGARAGQWAVALWAGVPLASELAGVAYVDLALTAFVLAGVYALLRWTESPSDGWLALAALFAGLGLATKYTAATWLAALILLFIYHALRHQRRPVGWIALRVAGFASIAGLMASPWLVKNWIITGNPVYPLLFGGQGWNPTREAWLTWPGHGYSRNPLDYLALPWLLTVLGSSGTAAFDATIGPLLLFLGPLAFLVRGRSRAVNYGLALVAGQLTYLAATMYRYIYLAETRLLLPAFPLLCLAGAFGLQHLRTWDRPSFRPSRIVGTLAALILAANLVTEARATLAVRPLAPLLGLESRNAYLARRLGTHMEAMGHLSDALPETAKILFLWEPRSYYAQRSVQADETLDNLAQMREAHPGRLAAESSSKAALDALRAEGFSYILLYRTGLQFLQGPTPRPPTLGSLLGQAPTPQSYYPLTEDDVQFLGELLAQCQPVGSPGRDYEVYQLP